MARMSAAQRRYEEQVARRAQPKKRYEVTVSCPALGHSATVTIEVEAVDRWLAQTQAMFAYAAPLKGEHVEYSVREI